MWHATRLIHAATIAALAALLTTLLTIVPLAKFARDALLNRCAYCTRT